MSTRTTVLWVPDWPVVAAAAALEVPAHLPAAVLVGQHVAAVNALARLEGVRRGMRRRQAQGCCPELVLLPGDDARDARAFEPVAVAAETVVAGLEVVRPGLLLLPAGGASRYHGSEDALAERLVEAVALGTGHECAVGTADGLLAAVVAARTGAPVPPGGSAAFLAGRPMTELSFAAVTDETARQVDELVSLLHRLGLRVLGQLAALPATDVHARFGRLGGWAHLLARGEDERPPARRRPEADLEVSAELDPPVDRVDTATFAGRRLAEDLHAMLVEHGLTCGRLEIAARTDEGVDLVRAWRTDLGGWGGLSPARITDRIRWQLEGWLTATAVTTARARRLDSRTGRRAASSGRAPDGSSRGMGSAGSSDPVLDDHLELPPDEDDRPVTLVRLAVTALDVAPAGAEQGRLWGGPSGGDLRAHRALDRVQGIVGGSGLLAVALQGGRDVREQVLLRPWGEQGGGEQGGSPRPVDRPWPGRLPHPAPATVLPEPEPVQVLDGTGVAVALDARAGLSAAPAWVSWGQGRRTRVAGWAGPWLLTGRWWGAGTPGGQELRGHVQVTFDDEPAALLVAAPPSGAQHPAATAWTCEARYD
ncbi:DNA polymerase Y family protein [Cellulomonas sp. DKR-3]|uniref:DNA polymerase Y family protein n=1 Tax=Cellulomonas fulva TaxID=2835530 RepID=A0ABS5U1L9_9CELL|nr:DNA polymerase Y family protein [Cellulomonas fulva]MBT0995270.1 DNA polymerase Y family protein [Cellulomonas fulva]